jgi:8-oxo-dGTP diphosphatase
MAGTRRPKQMRVVAALIREKGRVLLTQRRPGRHLGLSWEFPGGKVEAGETDEEALRRELREELGVEARVGTRCFETRHHYGNREMHLLVYRCRLISGEPEAIEVNAVEWVAEGDIEQRRFLPADLPLVHGIASGLVAYEDDAPSPDESTEGEPVVAATVVSRPADEDG